MLSGRLTRPRLSGLLPGLNTQKLILVRESPLQSISSAQLSEDPTLFIAVGYSPVSPSWAIIEV
jgi:hypothetical protein